MSCQSTLAAGLEVAIVDSEAQLDGLESKWNELFATSPAAAPPLRWNWVRCWWRLYGDFYGERGRGLRVLTVWRGSQLIGVLPLYLRRRNIAGLTVRCLIFTSTGAAEFEDICTEYLDLLYAPGAGEQCVQAIAPVLRHSPRLQWDKLELLDMPQASPLTALSRGFAGPLCRVRQNRLSRCHIFDMTGGFEEYTRRLSAMSRRNVKRVLEQVERCGAEFEVAGDAGTADVFFDEMVALHRRRWNAKGKFGSFAPRHAEFHRALARAGTASGEVGIARLSYRNTPLAVVYGHRVGAKFHCYQQGVDTNRTAGIHSSGNAAWFLLMKQMAERGVTLFDHLKGTSTFKERFGTGTEPLVDLRFTRLNFRTTAYAAADVSLRAARKAFRAARRAVNAAPPTGELKIGGDRTGELAEPHDGIPRGSPASNARPLG
jgi:CelD/BcsL family acetyltransferase involved in cellulose biosynthesis